MSKSEDKLIQYLVGQVLSLTKGPIDMLRGEAGEEKLLKNAKDECATEALEIATYDALEATAVAAGDDETAKLARAHRRTEERMLNDLRKQIARLAKQTFESRTDERAKASVKTAKRSAKRSPKRRAKARS